MYYMLRGDSLANEISEMIMEVMNNFDVGDVWSWTDGVALTEEEKNFPKPIYINFKPLNRNICDPPELYDIGVPFMSKRLGLLLLDCNVTNVELFPAILTNTLTNEEFEYFSITESITKVSPIDEPELDEGISFLSGKSIDVNFNNGQPLEFKMEVSDGSPPGNFYNSGIIPVASELFINMLKKVGIDNYQIFPAIITDETSGQKWGDYFAFNPIGVIDAAHADSSFHTIMPGSDSEVPALGTYRKLIFDSKKTRNIKMFREIKSNDLFFTIKLYDVMKENSPEGGWKVSIESFQSK